ncbi:MAG: AsmA-like C-terminal domain-containing protein [Nitrospirales bacterium]|nr:AsmA-like C-terminal domain-containing protein [Nitrospira sp.]MDR4502428.1 AsmA-like C-terminal domain-containing protein [Nitrospirales bacterium]
MKRRLRYMLLIVLTIVGCLIAVVLAGPFFLNPVYFQTMALEYMQRTLGPHIHVGRTHLSLWPYPHIDVADVTVKERPDTHAFFRAKRISLDLKIFSLLRREFSVKELSIEEPELEVKRGRDGTWWMFQAGQTTSGDSLFIGLSLIEKVMVADGRIVFIDESPREEARGIVLQDVDLSFINTGSQEAVPTLEVSGLIPQSSKTARFLWEGTVNVMSAESSEPLFRLADVHQAVNVDGMLKVRNLDVLQIADFFSVQSEEASQLGVTDIEGHMTLMPGRVGYELNVSDLRVSGQVGLLTGNANISGLLTDDLTTYASFQSTPISLGAIRSLIPSEAIPRNFRPVWTEGEIEGQVEVVQATVAGSTRPDVGVSVAGTFQLHESSWKSKGGTPNLENVSGEIVVEPDRIRLRRFHGMYESLPVESGNGVILFKDSGPWFEADIHGQISGEQVVHLMANLSQSPSTRTFLSRVKAVEGMGGLHLQFAGLLGSVEGVTLKAGEYMVDNLAFHFDLFKDLITFDRGRLSFTPTEVKLEEVHGHAAGSRFRLHGTIHTLHGLTFDRFAIDATVHDPRLSEMFSHLAYLQQVKILGDVAFHGSVSGTTDLPRFKGEFDLSESSMVLPGLLTKPRGVRGVFRMDVAVRQHGILAIQQAELAILPFRLSVRARVRTTPQFEFHARLNTGPINVGLLPAHVVVGKQIFKAGILEVSLEIQGKGYTWTDWKPRGWIALTEGRVDVPNLSVPLSDVLLRLKVSPTFAEVKRLQWKMQDSDIHLTSTIKNWRGKPEIDIVLESTNFNFDVLIPKNNGTDLQDWLAYLAGTATVMGNIRVDHPMYRHLEGQNLSSILRIRDGLLTLDRIRGRAYGKPIVGRVFVHLPQERPAAVRSSFHVKGVPLEPIQQSIGSHDHIVTGNLSMRGMIQGHGRDARGVLSTLNGHVDMVIKDGYVNKGTVLPRILELLNIPTILRDQIDLKKEGFPFRKSTATLQVANGVIETKNMIVESPIMQMTAVGSYNLVTDQLDGVTAISPFGRYSDFLKSIPLFGRILAGDRKGIATAMFDVRGPLASPDIQYMPMESFATGLSGLSQLAFDVLKNTITLPLDLLKSDSKEEDSETSKKR